MTPAYIAQCSKNLGRNSIHWRNQMAESKSDANEYEISRDHLAELLNEDLSREYQAIIAYVVYSQVLSGAQYNIWTLRPSSKSTPSRSLITP